MGYFEEKDRLKAESLTRQRRQNNILTALSFGLIGIGLALTFVLPPESMIPIYILVGAIVIACFKIFRIIKHYKAK